MIKFTDLPRLSDSDENGIFIGLNTKKNGVHYAVFYVGLSVEKMTWARANSYAKSVGGEIPSRAIAAMFFSNHCVKIDNARYWLNETNDSILAWYCDVSTGSIFLDKKSDAKHVIVIRVIPISGYYDL